MKTERCCAVVPAFCEAATIGGVVSGLRQLGIDVIVVDDGSSDSTASVASAHGAHVVRHETNSGKGAALQTGISLALERGYDWIATLDGDGQHDPQDLATLMEAAARMAADIICGNRMASPSGMPWIRRLTNRTMSRWISRAAGSDIPDSQCGFRLYRAELLRHLRCGSTRFEWESEILLRAAASGARIISAPVRCIYGGERSKIRPIRDTLRFWRMWRQVLRELRHSRNR
ncbi:MAG: glycosyltransferase family 2 protein [Kiritimatiellae bacterium]|nr:glycosyltransferase family 2 protein [Kiritimatiellia bacterium]MDW8458417.1 glycosyltransferase family 2 protein [Verrucomicrobiota bacterium]